MSARMDVIWFRRTTRPAIKAARNTVKASHLATWAVSSPLRWAILPVWRTGLPGPGPAMGRVVFHILLPPCPVKGSGLPADGRCVNAGWPPPRQVQP